MKWHVIWTPRAEKDVLALDPVSARRIHRALERFSATGHADIRRLIKVSPETSRIRVGDHRIIVRFAHDLREMHIIRIHRRDSAY